MSSGRPHPLNRIAYLGVEKHRDLKRKQSVLPVSQSVTDVPEKAPLPADPLKAPPIAGVPLPSLGTRLWFGWMSLVSGLATVPMSIAQVVGHAFDPTARNFKRWARLWGGMILGGALIRVEVEEHTALDPSQPYVFVSNHQNLVDILALAAGLPYPFGFIAKAELARVPMLGFALRQSASIFVDKSTPRKAIESVREAGERIRGGNSVLVFAEGMRTFSPFIYPLQRGAFLVAVEAGVPLVPVTVVDAYRLVDERHYTARPGRVRIVVGEPIAMEGKRRGDLPEIMAQVRAQWEAELAGEAARVSLKIG